MSKMIRKEFIPASQIFVAFPHHRKTSKNKIFHEDPMNTEEGSLS